MNEKNSVVLSVEFYFKGKKYSPSTCLDIDAHFQAQQTIESCYMALAKAGNIGLHSYELEVMVMEPIVYSEPTGMVADYMSDGVLDWDELEYAWKSTSGFRAVKAIANKIFNVENIDDHTKLATALMDAYQKGYEAGMRESSANKGLSEGFYG